VHEVPWVQWVHWVLRVLRVHWVLRVRGVLSVTCLHLIAFSPAEAQESVSTTAALETLQSPVSSQEHVHADTTGGWRFMDSGILYAQFNHQGSARGDDEFVAPSWWMGMGSRNSSHGQLTFASMFSLDPALVGKDGYAELFQVGEALNGQPLIDRQHPHDFFMQLSGTWRIPLSSSTGLTVAGGPVGEPAIGPVAFMHRASAGDNPTAPLGHHTLDSTHIAFGVVTAAVDHGPWIFEGSIFNGREPDDNRWNFDFGKLDSYSGRLWFRPTPQWDLQISAAHLTEPEELEPGNITRTTASASWTRARSNDLSAFTIAYGRNDTDHGAHNAILVEGARSIRSNAFYTRFEVVQVDTAILLGNQVIDEGDSNLKDPVFALTVGGVREVLRRPRLDVGIGGDITIDRTPTALKAAYGSSPVSFHVYLRLLPGGAKDRMWNMRMGEPGSGHSH
jgi:hypothetical protein